MAFRILILVASIAGQPVGVAKAPGNVAYPDKAACEAMIAPSIMSAQDILDGNETTKQKFMVVNGKCFTDDEIDQMQKYKERSANESAAEGFDG